jgi:DNA topoisomerase-1
MLGPGFAVRATGGHVKDLPGAGRGVDPGRDYAPTWVIARGKARVLSDLKRAARGAERVYLATDPDREGEAIAWQVAEELGAGAGDGRVRRVLLQEITPAAVRDALVGATDLDRRRHDAQLARRVLDRLVGFEVSELLRSKVRRGISAGRVQSVAVRLVVDREREIEAFRPEGSWTLEVRLATEDGEQLEARLLPDGGRPAEPPDREGAERLAGALGRAAFRVAAIDRLERRRPAPAPLTTARLQEEAGARLGFGARRTMRIAQRLYEGVELGEEGLVGLVTYPRTGSTRVADGAAASARAFAVARFGEDHLPAGPGGPAAKARTAREAHEAVRPTSVDRTPEEVRGLLRGAGSRDLLRLYELVWSRFVASQLAPAVLEDATAEIEALLPGAGPGLRLVASGTSIRFPGWLAVEGEERSAVALPPLAAGAALRLVSATAGRRASEPPGRFTEATLVRELDDRGLGRPSTYASVVETIQERRYVERDGGILRPTALGRAVTGFLVGAVPGLMDPGFTAAVEGRLDDVEEGTARWQDVVAELHAPLRVQLERAAGAARPGAGRCPRCGRPLALAAGRRGEFLGCTGYPACRHTESLARGPEAPHRGARAISIGGVDCPEGCGGSVTERRTRTGRALFGCSSYPRCDFVSFDRPRDGPCPECGSSWLVERVSRKGPTYVACPNSECGYRGGIPSEP